MAYYTRKFGEISRWFKTLVWCLTMVTYQKNTRMYDSVHYML